MGLEKAIEHGKEHRREYWDSRRIDGSCRNHHGCPWCEGKRLRYQRLARQIEQEEQAMRYPPSPAEAEPAA